MLYHILRNFYNINFDILIICNFNRLYKFVHCNRLAVYKFLHPIFKKSVQICTPNFFKVHKLVHLIFIVDTKFEKIKSINLYTLVLIFSATFHIQCHRSRE